MRVYIINKYQHSCITYTRNVVNSRRFYSQIIGSHIHSRPARTTQVLNVFLYFDPAHSWVTIAYQEHIVGFTVIYWRWKLTTFARGQSCACTTPARQKSLLWMYIYAIRVISNVTLLLLMLLLDDADPELWLKSITPLLFWYFGVLFNFPSASWMLFLAPNPWINGSDEKTTHLKATWHQQQIGVGVR